jgi:hypothetical protein
MLAEESAVVIGPSPLRLSSWRWSDTSNLSEPPHKYHESPCATGRSGGARCITAPERWSPLKPGGG